MWQGLPCAVLAAAVLGAAAAPAGAETLCVDPARAECLGAEAAFAAAQDGDRIVLAALEHDAPLASAHRIEVVGAGEDATALGPLELGDPGAAVADLSTAALDLAGTATRVRAGGPVLLRGARSLRAAEVDGPVRARGRGRRREPAQRARPGGRRHGARGVRRHARRTAGHRDRHGRLRGRRLPGRDARAARRDRRGRVRRAARRPCDRDLDRARRGRARRRRGAAPRRLAADRHGVRRRTGGPRVARGPRPPAADRGRRRRRRARARPGRLRAPARRAPAPGGQPPARPRRRGRRRMGVRERLHARALRDVPVPLRRGRRGVRGGAGSFFAGGPAASATATQRVDVGGAGPEIDRGTATVTLSGLLGGYRADADAGALEATFLDPAGAPIGTVALAAPTAAQRANATTLQPRTRTDAVPRLTRAVDVTLRATRAGGGSYDDAYFDNVALTLVAPGAPPPPPPGDPPLEAVRRRPGDHRARDRRQGQEADLRAAAVPRRDRRALQRRAHADDQVEARRPARDRRHRRGEGPAGRDPARADRAQRARRAGPSASGAG